MSETIASLYPGSLLDDTFGCLFLAVVFSSTLWGIGCLQLYLYCEKYWDTDKKWLKAYTFAIWILDTAHQALLLKFTYTYFVKGIVRPELLLRVPTASVHCAIISAFIDSMVQIVFVRRAWHVSKKNKTITGILCLAILVQFAITTAYYAQIYNVIPTVQFQEYIHTVLAMNYIIMCTDTLLAGVLVWLLYKSRSGLKSVESVVNKVILYTIASGLAPAIWSMIAAIGVQVSPRTAIYLMADLVIPKLYFNCMLASLNVRSSLRATLDREVDEGIQLENLTVTLSTSAIRSNNFSDGSFRMSGPRPIECQIDIDFATGSV